MSPPLWAQSDLQSRIDGAAAALAQLDSLAGRCRDSLQSESDEAAREDCQTFLAAIDGELLAGYLDHCRALKQWRDEFVNAGANPAQSSAQSESNLALMVGIERNCGENALSNQTSAVVSTFALLREAGSRSAASSAAMARRMQEVDQAARFEAERSALQNAVQHEMSRRRLETDRRWQALELENLRQQMRRPFPNTSPFPQ